MRLSLGILLITGAARLTVASPFTDALAAAPACAVTCAITALPQSPCTIENTTCLCTNPTFNGLIGDCVQKGCTIKEALTVQNLTWSACGFPSTDKRHSARYTIGCLIILPIIFMAIRLASWAFRLTPWGAEDTTVSLAFVCCTTRNIVWPPDFSFNQILFVPFPTLVLIMLSYGLGRDIWVLQPDEVTMFLKLVFIIQFFYIVDLALIKASILYLYLRVFHMSSIRTVLWGTQVFNFILCTLFVLLSIFQCQPIQHYWNGWDGEHAGKCLSLQDIVLAHVAINVGLDVWMLILPLTQIYKLNMPLRRKISVMAMFSVGIFLTIVSIVRIKSLLDFAKTPNITAELLGGVIWSHIELCVGIAVACMPAARHLAWRLVPKLLELSRRTLSKSSKTKPSVHVEELQPVAKGRRSPRSDTTTTLQSNTTTIVDPNTPNSAYFP